MELVDPVLSKVQNMTILQYQVVSSNSTDTATLTDVLSKFSKDNVAVFYAKYKGRDVVVKYYHGKRRDIRYEISVMEMARTMGVPIYWFSGRFTLLGRPVVVMEKLIPIDETDDVQQLMLDILMQLKYLNKFACHCDIKKDNVMKRSALSDKQFNNPYAKGLKYYLIDYGGCATKPDSYGYVRHTYNPMFTSQPRGRPMIVTYVHDLLELCYLANYLLTRRITTGKFDHRHDIKNPVLRKYHEYIVNLPVDSKYDERHYDNLMEIVRNGTEW